MSSKSNDQGRAYEFAWINTLLEALDSLRKTEITALNENKYCIYKRTASKISSRLFLYLQYK